MFSVSLSAMVGACFFPTAQGWQVLIRQLSVVLAARGRASHLMGETILNQGTEEITMKNMKKWSWFMIAVLVLALTPYPWATGTSSALTNGCPAPDCTVTCPARTGAHEIVDNTYLLNNLG